MRSTLVAAAACASIVSASGSAMAQEGAPFPARPRLNWIGWDRIGEEAGGAGDVDRIGELSLEPLRLALLGGQAPHPGTDPECRDRGAVPFARTAAVNLLGGSSGWKAPRLLLFGFSRGGCSLDRATVGGLSFVVPLRRDVFFVLSGGAIHLPAGGPGATDTTSTAGRADIVLSRPGGRSFTFGIGHTRGVTGPSFGGIF